ncbi:unnamed protein product [Scytosiphon promiscuus]
MAVVQRPVRLFLLACLLQHMCSSCGGFTSFASYTRECSSSTSSTSNGGTHSGRQARGTLQPRWFRHQPDSPFCQERTSWVFARGGGGTGRPPPLAGCANSDAEAGRPASPVSPANPTTEDVVAAAGSVNSPGEKKESAHLKLRSMGQKKGANRAGAAATAPWKRIIVDKPQAQTKGKEEQQQKQEQGETAPGSRKQSAREFLPQAAVTMAGATNTGKTSPPCAGSSSNGSGGGGDGARDASRDDDGGDDDGSATEAVDKQARMSRGRLPPGPSWLLEYRAPPAADGEQGEALYASLGDDISNFIVFLESAVARGESVRDSSGVEKDETGLHPAAGAGEEVPAAGAGAKQKGQILVSTLEVGDEGAERRLRALWTEGKLLSQERDAVDVLRGQEKSFSELLSSYTDRTKSNHWEEIPPERLLELLDKGCGPDSRSLCGYDPARPPQETLSSIKTVLEWFRRDFPYYYDGCHSCTNRGNNTFVGYVYPTEEERRFHAGRTEVYRCSSCGQVSRFARYAAVSKVLETRRGRCGEYSVLMMRMLEALGYACRWVVDWSDHVWVEARVGGRWVHVDPCEAAVDEPLLYESWGKKQTYILAFTPTAVVDVTEDYTRCGRSHQRSARSVGAGRAAHDDFEAAKARRDVDPDTLAALLADATKTLQGP